MKSFETCQLLFATQPRVRLVLAPAEIAQQHNLVVPLCYLAHLRLQLLLAPILNLCNTGENDR